MANPSFLRGGGSSQDPLPRSQAFGTQGWGDTNSSVGPMKPNWALAALPSPLPVLKEPLLLPLFPLESGIFYTRFPPLWCCLRKGIKSATGGEKKSSECPTPNVMPFEEMDKLSQPCLILIKREIFFQLENQIKNEFLAANYVLGFHFN